MIINLPITQKELVTKIFIIRNKQVMLDTDIAAVYQIETRRLNEQVKRNISRFPIHFMFKLTDTEWQNLMSQNATSSLHGGRRKLPYVFTEQGIAMLSAIINSEIAVSVSIEIMDAFIHFRKTRLITGNLLNRVIFLENKQIETENNINVIFNAIEQKEHLPTQGIFFNGQIFDAYKFVADIIRIAKENIILIDNYIDDTTLQLFAKRKPGIPVTIYTQKISRQLELDTEKFNAQYGPLSLKKLSASHDRFLILDQKEMYHIGASLKDLGKKIFAFSKMDNEVWRFEDLTV